MSPHPCEISSNRNDAAMPADRSFCWQGRRGARRTWPSDPQPRRRATESRIEVILRLGACIGDDFGQHRLLELPLALGRFGEARLQIIRGRVEPALRRLRFRLALAQVWQRRYLSLTKRVCRRWRFRRDVGFFSVVLRAISPGTSDGPRSSVACASASSRWIPSRRQTATSCSTGLQGAAPTPISACASAKGAGLQSHSCHEHHGHSAARGGNEGIVEPEKCHSCVNRPTLGPGTTRVFFAFASNF
jgi:hypothetical protein